MQIPAFAAAAAALLSLATPVAAQDAADAAPSPAVAADTTPRTSLQKGKWSLSFLPPGYSSSAERAEFGAWEMVGARTNLGLTLALTVAGVDAESNGANVTEATTGVDLGVNVKQYVMAPRDVTPFLLAATVIGASYNRREGPDDFEATTRGLNAGVRGAVGVEWFPVPRFSVSGYTGFALTGGRYESTLEYPDDSGQQTEATNLTFRTFTSGLSVQIYF